VAGDDVRLAVVTVLAEARAEQQQRGEGAGGAGEPRLACSQPPPKIQWLMIG